MTRLTDELVATYAGEYGGEPIGLLADEVQRSRTLIAELIGQLVWARRFQDPSDQLDEIIARLRGSVAQ